MTKPSKYMKLCIACKHHKYFEMTYESVEQHQCFRTVVYVTDLVTGHVSHSNPEICDHERAKEEPFHCGFGGIYHEERKSLWGFF